MGRIKNVMNYKKPAFWAVVLAVMGVVVCGAVLLTDSAPRKSTLDLSDLPAELEFRRQTTESGGTYLRFGGTVNGEKVWGTDAGSGASWHPADEDHPLGYLSMSYPPFDGGIKGYIEAYWTDKDRTAVTVSTRPMAFFSSWSLTYYWRFTVELSGGEGQVTEMKALGPETDAPGSIHYLPEAISDEEAVKLARIAAKLLMAAEDYDKNAQPDDPDGEYLAQISAEVAAQWEKLLEPYLPFGLSYEFNDPDLDGNGLSMWYGGKAVRAIMDTVRDMYIAEHIGDSFPEGAVVLSAVYENGTLVGLRVDGEA